MFESFWFVQHSRLFKYTSTCILWYHFHYADSKEANLGVILTCSMGSRGRGIVPFGWIELPSCWLDIFQISVKNGSTSFCDWFRKLLLLSKPIKIKQKLIVTRVRRFSRALCRLLRHWVVCVFCDWPGWFLWFHFTTFSWKPFLRFVRWFSALMNACSTVGFLRESEEYTSGALQGTQPLSGSPAEIRDSWFTRNQRRYPRKAAL